VFEIKGNVLWVGVVKADLCLGVLVNDGDFGGGGSRPKWNKGRLGRGHKAPGRGSRPGELDKGPSETVTDLLSKTGLNPNPEKGWASQKVRCNTPSLSSERISEGQKKSRYINWERRHGRPVNYS